MGGGEREGRWEWENERWERVGGRRGGREEREGGGKREGEERRGKVGGKRDERERWEGRKRRKKERERKDGAGIVLCKVTALYIPAKGQVKLLVENLSINPFADRSGTFQEWNIHPCIANTSS